jgi:hypothetical protein
MPWLMALLGALWPAPACGAGFCDCVMPRPVAEEREASAAVFAGTVLGSRDTTIAFDGRPYWMRAVTFRVDRAWKGVDAETATVLTGSGGGDCGYGFEAGKPYLVYAGRWRGEAGAPLATSICTRTGALSLAGSDVRELGPPVRTWTAATPESR